MGQYSMEFDFLANSGFVFSYGSRDGGFRGIIYDSGKDDTAFIQGQMVETVCFGHTSACLSGGYQQT